MLKLTINGDFVECEDCIGRLNMNRLHRWFLDLICRYTGHLLWRTDYRRTPKDGSLDVHATYCRRCFKGGYVGGDYFN